MSQPLRVFNVILWVNEVFGGSGFRGVRKHPVRNQNGKRFAAILPNIPGQSCLLATQSHHHFESCLQKMRSGLQHMTFGVSFNLSLEKVALPDALETLTFGKCFNQPMEKATGRGLSGFGGRPGKRRSRGKSFRDITVIHSWGKDSCRKLFSLPEYTAWRRDHRDPCFLLLSCLGKNIRSRSPGVESNWLENEACKTIGTFGVRQWNSHPFCPDKGLTYFHWEQICPLGSLNQSALTKFGQTRKETFKVVNSRVSVHFCF